MRLFFCRCRNALRPGRRGDDGLRAKGGCCLFREGKGAGVVGLRTAQFTLAGGWRLSRDRGHTFILARWSGLAAGGLFNGRFIEHLRLLDDETPT